MMEVQPESHTLRSHGVTVARTHVHDWLISMLLVVIYVILNLIHPFHRFVGKDMMDDLKYPLKDNTVPSWAVPIYAVLLPMAIFLFFYFRRRDVYDLHHAILGLLFSVLVTAVITSAFKGCSWSTQIQTFSGVVFQMRRIFAGSFAGLGFLSLYLSGKIKAFDRRGHVAKLCVVFLPLLVASLVAISRINDYWHHWEDVFAGGLLGWGPYAYFRVLEESRAATQPANAVNALNVRSTEAHMESQQDERNINAFTGISLAGDSSLTAEDLESRRR
ncbi:lipid phosphate phosphatase 3 [Actinidia rufa]|uniref:Lipid phosphate phosphatase 3 n=1 Tax=Actinidia rufa TaxID=165716 RepID=A0A7J0H7A0_9ERIC|nr:lipid phosphate phosphatase 3 [Actinidia rufa]